MNELTIGSGNVASRSIGAPLGEHNGGSFTRDFERKVRFCFYQGICKKVSGKGHLSA